MSISRRTFLSGSVAVGAAAASSYCSPAVGAVSSQQEVLSKRPSPGARRFKSEVIESEIVRVQRQIADRELAIIFANCLPNTLDTTVEPGTFEGKPDTFVITGDIDAMWLRDSSAQVWPYLPFCTRDPNLMSLIEGVIRRQTRCILIDPYANAFLRSGTSEPLSWSVHDDTTMKPGVGERKWEIDSLCYTIRLAYGFWKATGNTAPFDAQWREAARTIVRTFREQQRKHGEGPYRFQRTSPQSTETLALGGYGNPAKPVGLIHSGFRPSDDACIYPFFIPGNLFAIASLRQLATLADKVCNDVQLALDCHNLADEVETLVRQYGQVRTATRGTIWAYEVDAYGGCLLMDDANAPGLLSLDYLGSVTSVDRDIYTATRSFVLSDDNPYFFRGTASAGIGGPHKGLGYIWPMSIIFRAFSGTNDKETFQCLRWLRDTTAETHFMHESFWKDDPAKYTRSWFAWANTLFGELILKLAAENPSLLQSQFASTTQR